MQSAPSSYALVKGTNEFSLWAGGSPDSAVFIGKTPDRSLLLVGLRYGTERTSQNREESHRSFSEVVFL